MLLALAERSDTSDFGLITVLLICLGFIALVCGLALVPICLARWRRNPAKEGVQTATLFWAILGIGSLIYAANLQLQWSKERDMRFASGYYSQAQEANDAPDRPTSIWTILGAFYLVLLVWAPYSGQGPANRPQ